jgi:hypothetical protein
MKPIRTTQGLQERKRTVSLSLNFKSELKAFYLKSVLFSFMCPGSSKRYARDYTDEELRAQARDLECAVTIPVNVPVSYCERVKQRIVAFGALACP